jgi:hypothetical protein
MSSFIILLSPNIIRVIKSRRLRWAEHIVCMGEMRIHTKFELSDDLKRRDCVRVRTEFWLRTGSVAGSCEHEPLSSIKCREFLHKLSDY